MLYPRTSEEIWQGISGIYISAHCLLCSIQLFDFFLLDKSNMVNDVPENDNFCLNYCVCNVAIALLLVKYMRIASVIGILWHGKYMILMCKVG
jgi:hypothetical protein